MTVESNAQLDALRARYSPEQLRALVTLARSPMEIPKSYATQRSMLGMDLDTFTRKYHYLQDGTTLDLLPHQRMILDYAFNPQKCPPYGFQTIFYSTIKKSGKTELAGAVCRWMAETWGMGAQELYCLAHDAEAARGRVYEAVSRSIELDPQYDKKRRTLNFNNGEPRWRIIERDTQHIPTRSIVRAVSADYRGEAGSNPTASFWTELWSLHKESDKRLWNELTPVPTRPRSIRYVETYAGFVGESMVLWDLWNRGLEGRQLTRDDIPDWPFPDEDLLPIYVNEETRMFAYIDQGCTARRMPWQLGDAGLTYYKTQEAEFAGQPGAYARLHENEWVDNVDAFIPVEWWNGCFDDALPPLTKDEPLVVGVDASVTGDCTALIAVSRHPHKYDHVCVRLLHVATPSRGRAVDYDKDIKDVLLSWIDRYNVVQVCYDAYQLHYLMTLLRNDRVCWTYQFGQGRPRNNADKQLFDLIRDRKIHHSNEPELYEHIRNAAAQTAPHEDTKLRIVKRDQASKIDLVVALSMATHECLRLSL